LFFPYGAIGGRRAVLLRSDWAYDSGPRVRAPVRTGARTPQIIGAAIGLGAKDSRCEHGPAALQGGGILDRLQQQLPASIWSGILHARGNARGCDVLPNIAAFCTRLARATYKAVRTDRCAWVIGGDHSCAIGSWSGIASAYDGSLGLIWIDAHLDSHTPDSSPSGAVHGMPLACLLGAGPPLLTELGGHGAKLRAQNVCVLGVRSFEPAEEMLLQRLGVHVVFMDEIRRRGMAAVFAEAIDRVSSNTVGFGVTIDLDVIDPRDAPGVGSPEPGGIAGAELAQVLAQLAGRHDLTGVEIAEFNPERDVNGATATLIYELLASIAGKRGE
jgi:arginase